MTEVSCKQHKLDPKDFFNYNESQ